MADLKTDYKNDVLDTDVNTERTYNLVDANGNLIYKGIKIRETTVLATTGDDYGALQINEQNTKINQINNDLSGKSLHIIRDINTTTDSAGRVILNNIDITIPRSAVGVVANGKSGVFSMSSGNYDPTAGWYFDVTTIQNSTNVTSFPNTPIGFDVMYWD